MDLHSFYMFAEIAYDCLDKEQSGRPNIGDVVPRLEKALELARENRPIHSAPNHLAHLRIPLEKILSATNYFDDKNVIGEGGFGKRYKGQLLWSGELIDINARRLINKEWDEKEQQFWTEISMLSCLKHKNVVSIVGFCNEVGAETIIYKLCSRGRLENYLSDPMLLRWVKRLEISIGLAHALRYIHYDEPRDFSVIHRNNTIVTRLEKALELQLECENALKEHSSVVDEVEGHHPVMRRSAVLPDEKLGEGLLSKMVKSNWDDMIDPHLPKQMHPESLKIFSEIAYCCVKEERADRPYIDQVVKRLEKAFELQLKHENPELPRNAFDAHGSSHPTTSQIAPPTSIMPLSSSHTTLDLLSSASYSGHPMMIEEKIKNTKGVRLEGLEERKEGKECLQEVSNTKANGGYL
ncbi:kinase-like domain, phloem protein 2-like protein [Tanacetum coccineum]